MILQTPLPSLPGVVFRKFAGEPDYAALAAALTASEQADHSARSVTADDIGNAFEHLTNCDPEADLLIAEAGGEIAGYIRGWWLDGPPGRQYKHNAFMKPAWRRKGIGRALLGWMESRLRAVAGGHPAELEKVFQANVTQFQAGAAALLERAGYLPERYFFEMVRPDLEAINVPPLPEGIELRPARPEHYPEIWRLTQETSQEEWGYMPAVEADYQEWLSGPLFQPELWQIAWDPAAGQVVGTVLAFIHHAENQQFQRLRAYTEGIGVARHWRRRGLASALIGRSLLAQRAAGMRESAMAVDSANPSGAASLYETCGFRTVKRDTVYRKPL